MIKVLFLDQVHGALEKGLEAGSYHCVDGTAMDRDTIRRELADTEGIVIRSRFPMTEEFLKDAPKLRFIARSGAGMENIDENYCQQRGIILINAPEGNRNAVGEHALAMLLALLNKLHTADRDVRSGLWEREKNRGEELDGKTVGIIGYGNNGSAFARKLRGFDVRVLAYDKYKTAFGDDWVRESTMSELFEQADVISFHIPQNEETIFMGDRTFFESFKKQLFVINLARGKIVRIADLLQAITSGKVKGAALDVLEFEKSSFENMFEGEMPQEFKELLDSDQVILSPHVGGWTQESYRRLSEVLLEKIRNQFG
ncbi:MAG: phosphoglycerate dehydrogenase [Bacteroidetes bacterium]|nr:MAG: phosphoglycerate dehydrogenase [Bacteroidota bacterium]